MPEVIKITLLGSSGVGKTTLLASMYEQFQTISSLGNLQLIPQGESADILNKRLTELKSMLARGKDGKDFNPVRPGEGIQGTSATDPNSIKSFVFDFSLRGRDPFMKLHFYDYPGGYISEKATDKERKFVQKLLNDAAVVIVAIDTPALVMRYGRYNEYVNKPNQITEMFKEAYKNLQEPRLVILVPIKCEMEMRKGERSANQLLNSIKKEYAALLNFFESPSLASKVAVAVTPVQTLGCVECSRMVEPTTDFFPVFGFKKFPTADAEYKPKDTDQPLRYLLQFLVKLHLDKRNFAVQLFVSWAGLDKPLKDAIIEFAGGRKTDGGFAVIQGNHLLDIRSK
jgi:hypothetical protein